MKFSIQSSSSVPIILILCMSYCCASTNSRDEHLIFGNSMHGAEKPMGGNEFYTKHHDDDDSELSKNVYLIAPTDIDIKTNFERDTVKVSVSKWKRQIEQPLPPFSGHIPYNNPFHSDFYNHRPVEDLTREFNPNSCMHRCDTKGHNRQLPCQCNAKCMNFNDCCADYQHACSTCAGRCDDGFNSNLPCQCNKACKRHDDCCSDHETTCNNDDSVSATDAELQTLSEALLTADVNNCANLVTVNQQGSTSFHSQRDNAPLPLLTVQPAAYNKPTIVKLLPLYNNYVARTGEAEVVTNQETQEETAFLDVILPTSVMKKAEKFLIDKGFISTRKRLANGSYRTNNRAFRDAIHQIWFGLYSRENRTLGSSGFEHVFLGEIKQEKVQGFHNWVFFSKEEQNNNLNYKGKIGPYVSLGNKGMIVKHKFDWINLEKPISSMFVGTSPEFEIALYTVCFYARPGARCPVKLNNKNVNIQTHYSYRQGKRYVGSAFPDI